MDLCTSNGYSTMCHIKLKYSSRISTTGSERALLFKGPVNKGPDTVFARIKSCTVPPAFTRNQRNWLSPAQTISTSKHNILLHCWPDTCKLRQNDRKTYGNIAGRDMLLAFDHPVATSCDILCNENRTSTHDWVQYCCWPRTVLNLGKQRPQHYAASTN